MTIHKITAGDGYLYLTRQVAGGDVERRRGQDAAEYYTARGNPPGLWGGRGAAVMEVGGEVTEAQMKALFGHGMRPDAEAIMAAHLAEHVRAEMTDEQLATVGKAAVRKAKLGRSFPVYKPLEPFEARVAARLARVEEETGRGATGAEVALIQREEATRQRAAVAGFDLVFTPVKSVSLLWALDGRTWVRDAVQAAHEAARDRALALVEEHAAFTRDGVSGESQIATHGLTYARFDHFDNRLGEPNLHAHVAVSSKVLGVDGKWKALDARALYRLGVAASETYNTAVEEELTARLGVSFTARPDTVGGREPVREITGIDPAWVEHFARRRAAVEARYRELAADYCRTHGREPSPTVALRLAQQATLDTRQGKQPPRSFAELRAEWRESLTTAFGPEALTRLQAAVPHRRQIPAATPGIDVAVVAARVVEAVQERRSVWTVWNLLAEVERHLRGTRFPSAAEHQAVASAVLAAAVAPPLSVCVEAPEPIEEPAPLRRADGASVFVEHAAARYTSPTILNAEARLLHAARTPTTVGIDGPTLNAAVADYERRHGRVLDPGQRALVAAFACDGRLLVAGIGPAGAGKTTAMRALSDVTDLAGVRLVPLATSAAAAAVLAHELDRPAENLHKFLHEWTTSPHAAALADDGPLPAALEGFRLGPGDVVVVDEAGMAGTLNLDRLVALAASRGAVVRLLGDHRQLGAVESGGALRLIAHDVGAVELSTLYRFHNPAEAEATLKLRTGDTTALDFYQANNRIRCGSHHTMREAAYTGWHTDMLAGKTTLMAAATNTDTAHLAARARTDRVTAGQVEPGGVRLHDGNLAGVGDWIITRDNNRRLTLFGHHDFVKNGDGWRVTERHPDGSLTAQHLTHHTTIRLPAPYVATKVELLYAVTTHRAQGSTVDTAHPLIHPTLGRENLYVLASRAREHTTLYVTTHDDTTPDPDDYLDTTRFDPRTFTAREVLERILTNETAPLSATETIRTAQDEADSLATLIPRYTYSLARATRDHYTTVIRRAFTPELADDILTDEALPALLRALHHAESTGFNPTQILTTVAHQRTLTDAETLAGLLAWRINRHLDEHDPPNPTAAPTPEDQARYVHLVTALHPTLVPPPNVRAGGSTTGPDNRIAPVAHITTAPPAALTSDDHQRLLAGVLGHTTAAQMRDEPAWPALHAALHRTHADGWEPHTLLREVVTHRATDTAAPRSEDLARRIHQHLRTHLPNPRPDRQPDTDTTAWNHLTHTLKYLETTGADPHRCLITALTTPTTDPTAPPSLPDLVSRLNALAHRHRTDLHSATGLPPWVPSFIPPGTDTDPTWGPYLATRANLITTRTRTLAHQLAHDFTTNPPPWATHLPPPPDDPTARTTWLTHIATITAYRDHFQIRDNHPDRPLGPYIETGRPAHAAYTHAAKALTNLTHPRRTQPDPDTTRIATNLYQALPHPQRATIAAAIATHHPQTWPSNPKHHDDAASQPHHTNQLVTALVQQGHLAPPSPAAPGHALQEAVHRHRTATITELRDLARDAAARTAHDHRGLHQYRHLTPDTTAPLPRALDSETEGPTAGTRTTC